MESPGYSHHAPREESQSCFPIVSTFLTISLDFTILYLDKLKKESPTMAVSSSFIWGIARIFLGFKASDRQEQGHIIPIQMIALTFIFSNAGEMEMVWYGDTLDLFYFCHAFRQLNKNTGFLLRQGNWKVSLSSLWYWFPWRLPKLSRIQKPWPSNLSCLVSQISLTPWSLLRFFTIPPSLKWLHLCAVSFFPPEILIICKVTLCAYQPEMSLRS